MFLTLGKSSQPHLQKKTEQAGIRKKQGQFGWQSLESLGLQLILVYSHVTQLQMSARWVVTGPTILTLHLNDVLFQLLFLFFLQRLLENVVFKGVVYIVVIPSFCIGRTNLFTCVNIFRVIIIIYLQISCT